MHFSLPYNGDLNFLKEVQKRRYPIDTVYGKKFQDMVGGGRGRYDIANYDKRNLADAINAIHDMGAKFNYLLNAPCSSNVEFEREKDVIMDVEKLVSELKIDMLTVANPFLLKLLKRNFPDLKYSISIIAKVDSLEKVQQYEELGADEITVDYNIYRNFEELSRIRTNSKINLQLLVNDGYLFNCPWASYHFQLEGHDSQSGFNNMLKYISFCRFNCKELAGRDAVEFIKGMWIRPEDLCYYEESGYTKFKIIDRLKETEWLLNAIDAYHNRCYNGNLSDILCSFDTFNAEVKRTPLITEGEVQLQKIQTLKDYWDLKPFIDNQKLSEISFLEFFRKEPIDCRNKLCKYCGYCKRVAAEVVSIDRTNACNVVNNLQVIKSRMYELLASGKG